MQEIHAHHETHAILNPLTLLLYKPVSHPPVSFLEDEDCLMAFNQFGAGSNIWKSDKHQTLPEMTTRKVLKFNSTDIDYYLSLKPQSNGVPHMDQLCEIFHSMVYEIDHRNGTVTSSALICKADRWIILFHCLLRLIPS